MPTALVTGAGVGIGRATVERLSRAGWTVVAGVRREADGHALVDALGERVQPIVLDVTDEDVVGQVAVTQAVLPRLRRSAGRIVFVCCGHGTSPSRWSSRRRPTPTCGGRPRTSWRSRWRPSRRSTATFTPSTSTGSDARSRSRNVWRRPSTVSRTPSWAR